MYTLPGQFSLAWAILIVNKQIIICAIFSIKFIISNNHYLYDIDEQTKIKL